MQMDFKASRPDPRILIIQIVIAAILASIFRNLFALFLLVLLIDILLLFPCGFKVFAKNLIGYGAILLLLLGLKWIYIPVISDLFPLFLMLVSRFYPAYLAARVLIEKAPMNELLFSLQVCRVPKLVLIPLSVIYRYIPTIIKEIGYIRESLKMRNFNSSVWDKLKHPMQYAENFFVPLLYRSEKISEELSAASICKGLNTKRRRTCCTKVKLCKTDMLYLFCMALIAAGLVFINYYIILF